MQRDRKLRILTGAGLTLLVLAGIFIVPPALLFPIYLACFVWAAAELVQILRFWAPEAPLRSFLFFMPTMALALAFLVHLELRGPLALGLVAAGAGIVLAAALTVLWSKTPLTQAAVAVGFLAFALPYFVVPAVSLYYLHRLDPWLFLALMAVVGVNDSAAYFVGSWIGKHKVAPRVSPKKTWEGSIGGGLAALLTMAAWSYYRYAEVSPAWLAVAAATVFAAQLGDLVESLVKRGAGVKDSSQVLPGHGGVYDRLDALLFAAPVFLLAAWALGLVGRVVATGA